MKLLFGRWRRDPSWQDFKNVLWSWHGRQGNHAVCRSVLRVVGRRSPAFWSSGNKTNLWCVGEYTHAGCAIGSGIRCCRLARGFQFQRHAWQRDRVELLRPIRYSINFILHMCTMCHKVSNADRGKIASTQWIALLSKRVFGQLSCK